MNTAGSYSPSRREAAFALILTRVSAYLLKISWIFTLFLALFCSPPVSFNAPLSLHLQEPKW